MEIFFIIYLITINIVTFFIYSIDKHNAKNKLYRISEKNLMLLAVFGGSVGALVAIHLLRHKTKHLFFTLGVPLVLFIQVALVWFYFFR